LYPQNSAFIFSRLVLDDNTAILMTTYYSNLYSQLLLTGISAQVSTSSNFKERWMSITASKKKQLIEKFATKQTDTGSSEVQVALLTSRIVTLTEHFKVHKKDNHGRRGLLRMVAKRRKLLDYLKRKDEGRYKDLITQLELRR